MEATATATMKKEGRKAATRRTWLRCNRGVQLRIPAEMYDQMRQRANREALPLAAWIRYACAKELRRRKSGL